MLFLEMGLNINKSALTMIKIGRVYLEVQNAGSITISAEDLINRFLFIYN